MVRWGLTPARGVTTFLPHKPIWTNYYHERVSVCACWRPVKKWSVPHVPEYFLLAFSTGSTLYALSSTDLAANHKNMWVYIL